MIVPPRSKKFAVHFSLHFVLAGVKHNSTMHPAQLALFSKVAVIVNGRVMAIDHVCHYECTSNIQHNCKIYENIFGIHDFNSFITIDNDK